MWNRGIVARVRGSAAADRAVAGVAAILLGAILLIGSGFAGADALHDAAHDARHGFNFPCH